MKGIESTNLWSSTLSEKRPRKRPTNELEVCFVSLLRQSFIQFRERTSILTDQIESSFNELTVHNMEHIDVLWQYADLLLGKEHSLNPTEVFILGGAFLLHDAGLALSSYTCGPQAVEKNVLWRDCIAQEFIRKHGRAIRPTEYSNLQNDIRNSATETFLRLNHVKQAHTLGTSGFILPDENSSLHLIEDSDLRFAFGDLIGRIAYSHWWSPEKVANELSSKVGAFPGGPVEWSVDPLKLAMILRVSDSMQMDPRRAPAFRRALRKPSGIAEHHWQFQQRLLLPIVEGGGVKFTSSSPFPLAESEAWWLGQELIQQADTELRASDALLQQSGRTSLLANHVVGAFSSGSLAKSIQVKGWTPVTTTLHVSNVAQVVERLGGQ